MVKKKKKNTYKSPKNPIIDKCVVKLYDRRTTYRCAYSPYAIPEHVATHVPIIASYVTYPGDADEGGNETVHDATYNVKVVTQRMAALYCTQ